MRMKYCPNCGHPIKPDYIFCPNCHYRLKNKGTAEKPNSEKRDNHTNKDSFKDSNTNISHYPYRRHHPIRFVVVSAAVFVLLIAGIGAYSNNEWPFNSKSGQQSSQPKQQNNSNNNGNQNASQSQSNSNSQNQLTRKDNSVPAKHKSNINDDKPSANDGQTDVKAVKKAWSYINDDMQQNDNSQDRYLFSYFAGRNNNKDYKAIDHWEDIVSQADLNNDNNFISIKPFGFAKNGNQISFKVRYDLQEHHNKYHIQIFGWNATMNNNHKIITMKSGKTPEKDYRE